MNSPIASLPQEVHLPADRAKLLRDYAAGEISWFILRKKGFPNYLDVLAGLGELGLRPPVAPMDGPNVESRQRGRALLRRPLLSKVRRSRSQ